MVQKCCCACCRAVLDISSRRGWSSSRATAASVMAATSPTGKSSPFLPLSISSGTPPLHRPKVGQVNEQSLAGLGVERALLAVQHGVALVDVTVDEVLHDLDGSRDAEGLFGACAEMSGDGSDSVRTLDAVTRDGEVGTVQANQRDISPMQRGDEGKPDAP